MSFMKDLFIEAMEELESEAGESGTPVDEDKLCEMAHKLSMDKFYAMCDAAKDRAKYE